MLLAEPIDSIQTYPDSERKKNAKRNKQKMHSSSLSAMIQPITCIYEKNEKKKTKREKELVRV
jgi:hypothetical protein